MSILREKILSIKISRFILRKKLSEDNIDSPQIAVLSSHLIGSKLKQIQ